VPRGAKFVPFDCVCLSVNTQVNRSAAPVLRDGKFVTMQWQDVVVGDIVKVRRGCSRS
jgi:magnesium-transporting ATPase (P-type)